MPKGAVKGGGKTKNQLAKRSQIIGKSLEREKERKKERKEKKEMNNERRIHA